MNCKPITDIHVLIRYHKIDCYAIPTSTTRKKQVVEKFHFKSVTRPDLSRVPFNLVSKIPITNLVRIGTIF